MNPFARPWCFTHTPRVALLRPGRTNASAPTQDGSAPLRLECLLLACVKWMKANENLCSTGRIRPGLRASAQ